MCAAPTEELAPFLRKIGQMLLCMNGFSQTGCNESNEKK